MKKPQLLYLTSGFIILTGLLCAVSLVICTTAFFIVLPADTATTAPSSVQISRLPPLNTADSPPPPQPQPQPLEPTAPPVQQISPELQPSAPSVEQEALLTETVEESAPAAEGPAAPPPQPVSEEARLVIANLDREIEVVDLRNIGGASQDITGWRIFSETGGEECLLRGIIEPGATLRIWSQIPEGEEGGYSCGYPEGMWNDETEDAAILYNAQGDIIYQRR